jgi:hypothetical protein
LDKHKEIKYIQINIFYLSFQLGLANIDETLFNIYGTIIVPPIPQASLFRADSAITLILKSNNTQTH